MLNALPAGAATQRRLEVLKVQPSDDFSDRVNALLLTDTSAVNVSPGLTGYCLLESEIESAGYISYHA